MAGKPEGYAVDAQHGRFYTNLEDKDQTIAFDIASHQLVATLAASCGEEGQRGLRFDESAGLLLVACTNKIEALDVGHDGNIVGSIATGDGVDDFDFSPTTRTLYAAASHAATLTVAHVDAHGAMTLITTVPTEQGARNGVVDDAGVAYVPHGSAAELLVCKPRR